MKLNFESKEEISKFIADEVLSTNEALQLLGGTRQNLHKSIKLGKIRPIKATERERWFFKEDILSRKAEIEKYHDKRNKDV
ncbi:DNA-binding protein [Paenibacillus alvei]|uniref:hypothetical protein n=1 Tax=Paenibacillus alvei TaxID=44250 RepID=UPI0002886CF2|nr:hypothetical protein [Paenibacillus alvei]EJW17599.1 hypothetical protein PAV_3c00440 [Paenibacillus alvei DSM 29]MCY9540574.1 DNA-binding protein [Paenibacillus alvei]MCY9706975.1 DNA-binding protein [Paenibacillus alvei]MCY9736055.1 DNA-binding protein [Paenibacillus alvei]MCY9755881.1 DNA-binding protein [Paenibacillus alvei]